MINLYNCHICKEPLPSWHDHHVYPVALGGDPDGEQVKLCARCHHLLHAAASDVLKGGNPIKFFQGGNLKRAQILINTITKATLSFNQENNPDQLKKITVELPSWAVKELHRRKTMSGYTSLAKYITSMFLVALKDKKR